MSALLGVVRESSLNSSDGLYKSKTYYQSPEVFKGLRKAAGLDPQICEAVVVGGGPGGIATAHHLAQRGVDVVLFEAGSLGQAFSDAGAGHTHELRTNQYQSSLARDKVVSRSVLSDAGMQYVVPELGLDGFAEKARQARADFLDMSLGTERMSPKERMDPLYPVNRNLFWSYLATLADKAVEAGSATIIEHSPLSPRYPLWDAKRNLWCVQTAQGHEIYAQKLVLATGLQGSSVENSRLPDIFQKFAAQNEENTLTLLNRKQLREKADEIAALMSNQSTPSEAPQKKVILHDSNLGQPEIQSYIRGLKEGTRAVLVGSGESAIKAALDFLDQNPGCNLDFYCKGKLYPYQVQFPIVTRGDEPFERAVFDEEFAKITLAQVGKVFGSPVTPRSLADLLNAVKDGRVRLFEMGEKFDDSSVELMPGEGGKAVIRLNPKNDKIWTQLKEQEVEFKAHGILDSAQTMLPRTKWQPLTECDGPIIIATGYDQERASQRNQFAPYLFDAKQIVALNRDDFLPAQYEMAGEGSVASKSNSHLFTLGTVNPQSAYDTNLTGIGTRAHFIAAEIAASLGKGLPEEKFEPGVPREPEGRLIYEQMQADSQRRRAVFQHADDLYIAQLADKESKGTLEPVERVVLDRFRTLHDKVDTALIDWTIDRGSYTKPLFENLANVSDRIVRSKN
ncbi:MAG: FAD-binding oxidoreductase [Deltaproteobacteria bacterium]|nr:FAD-binding oxidoreductase [Deltaproteobacteria bacterium]